MNELTKRILKRAGYRFIRAFVAGAIASMSLVVITGDTWTDIGTWLNALAIAGVIGGLSGLIQATDKYLRDVKAFNLEV